MQAMKNLLIPPNETLNIWCFYDKMEYLEIKFWLIFVFGGGLSVAGIVANVVLLNVFLKSAKYETYWIYLISLATVDIGILATYFCVMSINILYDYTENVTIYSVWLQYVPYFFTLSRILTMIACYIVLVASTERYLSVLRINGKFVFEMTDKTRRVMIIIVFFFCAACRTVTFWEVEIIRKPNCTSFAEFQLVQSDLSRNPTYRKAYSAIFVQTVQTFVPFAALVLVNFLIISQWRDMVRKGSENIVRRDSVYRRWGNCANGLCTARRTMIALMTCYLLCNALNVVITVWEDVDKDFLQRHAEFYTFVADVVSLMTAFNSATRLGVYFVCNQKIRKRLEELCSEYQSDLQRWGRRVSTVAEAFPLMPMIGIRYGAIKETQTLLEQQQ